MENRFNSDTLNRTRVWERIRLVYILFAHRIIYCAREAEYTSIM